VDLVLVHGSFHGAWCWERLIPALEAYGHRVIAVDLPISEPGLGADAYAMVVSEAIDHLAGDAPPAIVAHSMAGLVVPLVAARRPIDRMIFLAARPDDGDRALLPRRFAGRGDLGQLATPSPVLPGHR
jgi:pimeloyl-ACP methyl ester carboxylesterase